MAVTAWRTTVLDCSASARVRDTTSCACVAPSAVWRTVAVNWSSVAAVCSRLAACCSVRRDRSSAAWTICPVTERIPWALPPIAWIAACNCAIAPLKSSRSAHRPAASPRCGGSDCPAPARSSQCPGSGSPRRSRPVPPPPPPCAHAQSREVDRDRVVHVQQRRLDHGADPGHRGLRPWTAEAGTSASRTSPRHPAAPPAAGRSRRYTSAAPARYARGSRQPWSLPGHRPRPAGRWRWCPSGRVAVPSRCLSGLRP